MDFSKEISLLAEDALKYANRPPILGRVATSDIARRFREIKLALKSKRYPIGATKNFVRDFLKRNEEIFTAYLDKNSILVPVPSGSGMNMVTELFSAMLQKKTGCSRVSAGAVWKTHTYEAKHTLSLEKRLKDPIGFGVDEDWMRKEVGDKRVYILDDLIGTGESAIRLKQTLEKSGVKVEGLINLVAIERSYPTVKDIVRVVSKICTLTKDSRFVDLTKDCCKLFGEFTRQKLNRVEREIKNEKSALKALNLISYGASLSQHESEPITQYEEKKLLGLHY